jgi:BlaI family transcriptional regulator, penicillinase repressor
MDEEVQPPTPTPAELSILQVMWKRGPSSVRTVQESLGRATGYTTVLKLLQIMLEKGLVARDESDRAHVYRARVPADVAERRLVDELRERAFGGSTAKLVLRALADAPATMEELDEIRALLGRFEAGAEEAVSRAERE